MIKQLNVIGVYKRCDNVYVEVKIIFPITRYFILM